MDILALTIATVLLLAARAVLAKGRQMEQHTRNDPPRAFALAPSDSGAFKPLEARTQGAQHRRPS